MEGGAVAPWGDRRGAQGSIGTERRVGRPEDEAFVTSVAIRDIGEAESSHREERGVSATADETTEKTVESVVGMRCGAREGPAGRGPAGPARRVLDTLMDGVGDGEIVIREDIRVLGGRTTGEEAASSDSEWEIRGVPGTTRWTVVTSLGYIRSLLCMRTRARVFRVILFRLLFRDAVDAAIRATSCPPNASVMRGWFRSAAMSLI